MIGHALPVYQGYSSQYGHGLGNVLGGVMRAAVPVVSRLAKKAGAHLLDAGINYLQDRLIKKRPAPPRNVPAKRRKVEAPLPYKKKPPGRKLPKKKPRHKGDIFQ